MRPGVNFQWGLVVADSEDLPKVFRQKAGNGASLLVLVDVAEFMRNESHRCQSLADIDSMAECQAVKALAEESYSGASRL